MEKLTNDRGLPVPLVTQLLVFLVQLSGFLIMDWVDVRYNYQLMISDIAFWSVLLPITWLIYTLISYHYSHDRFVAIIQGLAQTLVSYSLIVAITLFFHQWIGGSF